MLIPLSRIGLDTTIIMGSILVIVLALVVLGAVAALVASIQSYLKARRIARGEVVAEEEEGIPNNKVEVIIEKNRSGARGTVELIFQKEYNKFSSISKREDV